MVIDAENAAQIPDIMLPIDGEGGDHPPRQAQRKRVRTAAPTASVRRILADAQKGDPVAVDALYRDLFTPVYRYVYLHVKSAQDAEDVTQNVFVRLLSCRWPMLFGVSERAYVFRIARNLVIDYWRARARHGTRIPLEEIADLPAPQTSDAVVTMREAKEHVEGLLSRLSQDVREVVILRHMSDLPFKDVARIVKKNEVTVRQMYHRALKEMHRLTIDKTAPKRCNKHPEKD